MKCDSRFSVQKQTNILRLHSKRSLFVSMIPYQYHHWLITQTLDFSCENLFWPLFSTQARARVCAKWTEIPNKYHYYYDDEWKIHLILSDLFLEFIQNSHIAYVCISLLSLSVPRERTRRKNFVLLVRGMRRTTIFIDQFLFRTK